MASEIKLSHLAVHLISKSAVIEKARATDNPEAFIENLIRSYNARKQSEKKSNSYDYKPVEQLRWDRSTQNGMHLKAYYSRRPHKGDSAQLLSTLSGADYEETFTSYQLHFAYFLYFAVSSGKKKVGETKVQKVWALFVLTTNGAFRVVRPYCDYRFPTRVAFRIMVPKFHKKEIKPLVGNKEADVSTYKKLYDMKLNAYRSLWILYKNFDATVKPGSSLHRALALPAGQKIQLHIGEGMVRLGGGYTLTSYGKILPLLFNMKRNWVTTRLDGTDEQDDPAFQTFANIRRVNMSEQKKLDSQLMQMLWKAVTTESPLPSLYLSHWYYHQYYGSTSFKLSICSKSLTGSYEWTYPPTFNELVDQLKYHHLGTLSFEEFEAIITRASLRCNEMGSTRPLMQYVQGEVAYEGNIYYRMEGVWLKITNQHLATTERQFLTILEECLVTRKNKKGHLLPHRWVSKEAWAAFSSLDTPKKVSTKAFGSAVSTLRERKASVIDSDGVVQLGYPVRALFQGESTSTIKKLKKRWEELKTWLQKHFGKKVKIVTLKEVFPEKAPEFFALLQKQFSVCAAQHSGSTRMTPIGTGGKVLFADLTQVVLPKSAPKSLSSRVDALSQILASHDSINEDDLKEEIPQPSYRRSAYKWLQKTFALSEETSSRYVVQGPIPADVKMTKALRVFLGERHQEYCRVMDEEQYSRLYLNDPNYLVFDQIFPGEREHVELFDLLYLGEEGKLYLYAIKEGFNNSTGIACTQIRVAMKNIQAALLSNDKMLLRNLYLKGVNTKATSDFRVQLQSRLKQMTCEDFVRLFVEREIVFVYAFLDTNDADRRLENELGLLQAVTRQELVDAEIEHPRKVLLKLEKEGYLDPTAKLTDTFLRETKAEFEKKMNVPGLYEVLMRRVSLYDSMIAKLEIIKLFEEFKGTNFTFQIHQLDRPGKVATHFNYSTLEYIPGTTHLFQGKVTCGKATYSFNRTPKALEEIFSQLLGQEDPYSAFLVLGGLREDELFPRPNQVVTEDTLREVAALLGKTLVFVDESAPPAEFDATDIVIIKNDVDYYVSREASIPDYDSSPTYRSELNLYEPDPPLNSVGLINLYNDCFLNATLQVLFQSEFHRTLFLGPDEDNPLSWALRAFSLQYEFADAPLRTNYLRKFMTVSMSDQEDPAEVLGNILDAYELGIETPTFHVETVPSPEGVVKLEDIPDQVSTLDELADCMQTHSIVTLPIPKKGATFQDCWKAFESSENDDPIHYLEDDTAYQSPSYTQTFTLQDTPTFLFVQFLRFSRQNPKITHSLNLKKTLQLNGTTYEVTGAIIHEGDTPTSGHYTSVVKTDRGWQHFDDTTITEVKPVDIPKYLNQAYILLLKQTT